MRTQSSTNLVIRSSLAVALALAIWSPTQARSAEPADGKTMMEGKMMESCQEMKEQKQQMKEDIKARDAELSDLIAKMNSAPDDKKMSLMADVVTKIAEQRITMDARKTKMEDAMMTHMMEHMQMGRDSMSECPMMKAMDVESKDAQKRQN